MTRDFDPDDSLFPPSETRTVTGVGEFGSNRPHPAQIYDHWFGGKDGFAADRRVAEQVARLAPWVISAARGSRAFLGRATRYLARAGISQFLDVGSGLPAAGNVHEVAQRINPHARVVYLDNDPSKSGCVHAGIA